MKGLSDARLKTDYTWVGMTKERWRKEERGRKGGGEEGRGGGERRWIKMMKEVVRDGRAGGIQE